MDLARAGGEAVARIAAKYRVSEDALSRHFASHLHPRVARVQALVRDQVQREEAHAIDITAELERCMARVNLLFDACDRWLRDPDNPAQYDIGARADDVSVIYTELIDGKQVRKRAKLSRLLAKLEDGGVDVGRGEIRHADPRDLILKTHDRLQGTLELLAKLLGELDERPTVTIVASPQWHLMRSALVDTLAAWPDARAAVAARLMVLEAAA